MIQLIGLRSDCDIDIRQKFSVVPSKLEKALKNLSALFTEVVVINTCNRTEIYIESNIEGEDLIKAVFQELNWSFELIPYIFYVKDNNAVRHIMELACGFHSRILGEDQILGQIKMAYDNALEYKTLKGNLQRLFQNAITCGKKFKATCSIYKIPVSTSSIVAKEALGRGIKKYMLVGFGDIGELTSNYLLGSDIEVLYIVVRDVSKVETNSGLKNHSRVKFINFDERKAFYSHVDCIISCTSAPHIIIHKEDLPLKDFLIFDMAVPRDIEVEVETLPGVHVMDIDDLGRIDEENKKKRKEQMELYRYIIDEFIKEFMEWKSIRELSPEIQKIKFYGEEVSRARSKVFKNKRNIKNDERLAETLLKSVSNVYVNRAIEVLKEAKLGGREEECLKIIQKIFYPMT